MARIVFVLAALAAALVSAQAASASQLLDRNTSNVSIKVDAQGRAVVYYSKAGGVRRHALVWGAINARAPHPTIRQVGFKVDYSGGWGSFGKNIWKTIKNTCRPYEGDPLPWLVAACTAPDGSHWALQEFRRLLPAYGMKPWTSWQAARELHVSHWSGELPKLEVWQDWVYSVRVHEIIGRFTYKGHPVHGFKSNRAGVPLDSYGRLVSLDTFNSAYGKGWRRENTFLVHKYGGNFCYGFFKHKRPAWYPPGPDMPHGNGERYMLTAQGPGVTPLVRWEGEGLPDYDKNNPAHVQLEKDMNVLREELAAQDTTCHVN